MNRCKNRGRIRRQSKLCRQKLKHFRIKSNSMVFLHLSKPSSKLENSCKYKF